MLAGGLSGSLDVKRVVFKGTFLRGDSKQSQNSYNRTAHNMLFETTLWEETPACRDVGILISGFGIIAKYAVLLGLSLHFPVSIADTSPNRVRQLVWEHPCG